MTPKVTVGVSSIVGYLTAFAGAIPILVRLVEEGAKGLTLAGPEKWAAIISIVSLAVTQIGRYLQAIHLIKATPPAS